MLNIEPEKIPLEVVFEDDVLLVVNKPAGMVTHPGPGNFKGTLVNALLYYSRELSSFGGTLRPGIVHRLDKDTSGLLLVAKTDSAHRFLAKQFQERSVLRKYIAVVKGKVQLDEGTIDEPLGRHVRNRKKIMVKYSRSRRAKTLYKV